MPGKARPRKTDQIDIIAANIVRLYTLIEQLMDSLDINDPACKEANKAFQTELIYKCAKLDLPIQEIEALGLENQIKPLAKE